VTAAAGAVVVERTGSGGDLGVCRRAATAAINEHEERLDGAVA
jgi:bacterioferritin-associated ferredoxin